MKTIPLTNGKVAVVDDVDFEQVSRFDWRARKISHVWYAVLARGIVGGRRDMFMHRLILGATEAEVYVDHKNGDGLDNRRHNLRQCSNSQNQANRRRLSTNTSGYRGVTWSKSAGKWQASIKKNGKSIYLGQYTKIQDAARAYDRAAIEMFGEFARPNFG